jgi:hypothetical protein
MTIQEILENCGFEVSGYSGRGMYGETCLSVRLKDSNGIGNLIYNLVYASKDGDLDEEDIRCLRNFQTDSLGLGMVAYFPNIPYEGDSDNYEDEDD